MDDHWRKYFLFSFLVSILYYCGNSFLYIQIYFNWIFLHLGIWVSIQVKGRVIREMNVLSYCENFFQIHNIKKIKKTYVSQYPATIIRHVFWFIDHRTITTWCWHFCVNFLQWHVFRLYSILLPRSPSGEFFLSMQKVMLNVSNHSGAKITRAMA